MATAINRNTMEFRRSIHEPDYENDSDWIINPAGAQGLLDAGVPWKYWKLDGDTVVEMTAEEKAVVDSSGNAPRAVEVTIPGLVIKDGLLEVANHKPTDTNDPFATHNLCDKTTWFQKATQNTGFLTRKTDHPSEMGDEVWGIDDGNGGFVPFWVDTEHGKCGSLEHYLGKEISIQVDTAGGSSLEVKNVDLIGQQKDFYCNYREGYIKPHTAWGETASVAHDVYIAGSSKYHFFAPKGKQWNIDTVEVQFGKSSKFKEKGGSVGTYVIFSTLLYINDAEGNKTDTLFPVDLGYGVGNATSNRRYKTKYSLVDEANYHYEISASNSPDAEVDLTEGIDVHGWAYKGVKRLSSHVRVSPTTVCTTVLEISTQGDRELQGEYAKVTLYVLHTDV